MSVFTPSSLHHRWAATPASATELEPVLNALKQLHDRLDAIAYATELRLSAMETHLTSEVQKGTATLARFTRQRERRQAKHVDGAVARQTDELLATLDAWLPASDHEGAAVSDRRPRRWLVRALLAAMAASSLAWSLIPFEAGHGVCDPAVSVAGGGTRCADAADVRIVTSAAGVVVTGGAAALVAARSRRRRRAEATDQTT